MRITPAQMAEIYWAKLKRGSFNEVEVLIKRFMYAPASRAYWVKVQAELTKH